MELSILIPEHSRPLRLKQVVRNIRETSRFHHEIVVVADRIDMGLMYDYEPELVDAELVKYLKTHNLSHQPCFTVGNYGVEDCLKQEGFLSFRSWLELNRDYFEKYDVVVKECPLDYKITEDFAVQHSCLPHNKRLRDLKEWDFGADVVLNWMLEQGDFKNEYVMVTDDDMFFLKDWDYELLKHVDEDELYEMVYTPKVYNVKHSDGTEKLGLKPTLGAFTLVEPSTLYLDINLVNNVAQEVNQDKPEVSIEPCGLRSDGTMLPMVIHKRLWRKVHGRSYLIGNEKDWQPGRFIGGAEVHFDDKLWDLMGVQKKICWKSICIHTKHPLKFGD